MVCIYNMHLQDPMNMKGVHAMRYSGVAHDRAAQVKISKADGKLPTVEIVHKGSKGALCLHSRKYFTPSCARRSPLREE